MKAEVTQQSIRKIVVELSIEFPEDHSIMENLIFAVHYNRLVVKPQYKDGKLLLILGNN